MMYSLYVGQFKTSSESKNCQKQLSKAGYSAYLFYKGNYYTFKVYSSPNEANVIKLKLQLDKKGFETRIETL